jgi:hypothetical protein
MKEAAGTSSNGEGAALAASSSHQASSALSAKRSPILHSVEPASEQISIPGRRSGPARKSGNSLDVELEDVLGGQLASRVREKFRAGMSEDVQKELSALLTLLPAATRVLGSSSVFRISTAIEAILAEKPQLTAARELKQGLRTEIRSRTSLVRVMSHASPVVWIKLGAAQLLIIAVTLWASLLVSRAVPASAATLIAPPVTESVAKRPEPLPAPAEQVTGKLDVTDSAQPSSWKATTTAQAEPPAQPSKPTAAQNKSEWRNSKPKEARSRPELAKRIRTETDRSPVVETPQTPSGDKLSKAPQGGDDEFDREFGSGSKTQSAKPPTVYIPPAPGYQPDAISSAEIMEVVFAHKPAILDCASEQKKKDPRLGGKIVMRWNVLSNGRVEGISCTSDELQSSFMAQCLTRLIKGWRFPPHSLQSEPINFPFSF